MEGPRQAKRPESPAAWWTSGRDTQVFVDHTGRRARGVRVAGIAAAALCAFWLVGLTVGMAGFSGFRAVGLHELARAGLARHGLHRAATLRADAIADRSALAQRRVASVASRGREAAVELPLRGPSCSGSPVASSAGRTRGEERRSLSAVAGPRVSAAGDLARRSACTGSGAPGPRQKVNPA
jgi:hypothetical protein